MIIKNIGSPKGVDYDLKCDETSGTWNTQRKEFFRIGEDIAGVKCFVKRYKGDAPPAKALLKALATATTHQIAVNNLPKVYDLVETSEGQTQMYYYVTECLEGNTLDNFLKKDASFSKTLKLKVLHKNLLQALQQIHKRSFWFSDFNEKNIFYNTSLKSFYLIDVDSAWSQEHKPQSDEGQPGGLPSASLGYASLVETLYRKRLNQPPFRYNQLNGNNLNYLQLLVFVGHMRYYQHLKSQNPVLLFGDSRQFEVITDGIHRADAVLCQSVCNRALEPVDINDADFFKDLIKLMDKISAFEDWNEQPIALPKIQRPEVYLVTAPIQNVEIISFRSSIIQTEQKINQGDTVHLTWIVLGNKERGVLLNGKVVENRGKETIKPLKTTTYTLTATNNNGKSETATQTIYVQQNTSVWKWAIAAFISGVALLGGYTMLENYQIDNIPIAQAFESGKQAYQEKQHKKAYRLLTRCIERNLNKEQAYYWRGMTSLKLNGGDHDKGCQDIKEAALLMPNNPAVRAACANDCSCK